MLPLYRILDANLNRANEGLRTLEEFARFILEDSLTAMEIKAIRHDLGIAATNIDRECLLSSRDTAGDVGTTNKTASEFQRCSMSSVVTAAAERVGQSLRCLEEYGKVLDNKFAESVEQIRYRSYDVLAKIDLAAIRFADQSSLLRRKECESAKLYLLMECERSLEQFLAQMRQLSEAGVDWFQVRDKKADTRKIVQFSKAAIETLKNGKSKVFINDRIDIAIAVGAAGVHLGQEDMSIIDARRIAPKEMLIGVSTHSIEQAIEAEKQGADYVGCGPTFQSTTKSFESYKGVAWLQEVAQQIAIPAFAIGGVNATNIKQVVETGIRRVAVSGGIWNSQDPANSARQIREKL